MCVCPVFCFLQCLAQTPGWEPAYRPHSEPQKIRLDQKEQLWPSTLRSTNPSQAVVSRPHGNPARLLTKCTYVLSGRQPLFRKRTHKPTPAHLRQMESCRRKQAKTRSGASGLGRRLGAQHRASVLASMQRKHRVTSRSGPSPSKLGSVPWS